MQTHRDQPDHEFDFEALKKLEAEAKRMTASRENLITGGHGRYRRDVDG